MNCKHFEEIVIDLLRLKQQHAEYDQAVFHTAACNECSLLLQEQRKLSAALKTLAEEDNKIGHTATMPRALATALQDSSGTTGFWLKAAVFVVGLALAVVGYNFRNIANETKSQATYTATETAVAEATEDAQAYTEFVPLVSGDPAPDLYQVVRVKLPRRSLLQFGLPINPERADEAVTADLVVGENGLPHAIRFVNDLQ